MTDRKPHQCQKTGCDSQATSGVRLFLPLPSPGEPTRVFELKLSMEVCDRHRDDVRPWALSPENQANIRTAITDEGLPEPDFLTARIDFVPIQPDPVVVIQPCTREGCANPAKWQIKQLFPAVESATYGVGSLWQPAMSAMTNLYVCDKHMRETTAADLLHGDGRQRTEEFLRAKDMQIPDLDRMTIEFMPVRREVT